MEFVSRRNVLIDRVMIIFPFFLNIYFAISGLQDVGNITMLFPVEKIFTQTEVG